MSTEVRPDDNYIGNELEVFALAKNWKSYWSSKISPLLGQTILEVGAGIGSNLDLLYRRELDWTALEPDIRQAALIEKKCLAEDSRRLNQRTIKVVTGDLSDIDEGMLYDSILYIDVLEHIEQDDLEIRNAFAHLKNGGHLIVLAPAHQSLFSPFDKAVGHYRRYNKSTLRNLSPSGASVIQLFYLDSIGCLASWLNSKILKSAMPSRSQILLWDSVMVPMSRLFDWLLRYQLGKTVIMVWQK